MQWQTVAAVAGGGAIGSVARLLVSGWASRIEPHIAGTIVVNVAGCFLIGLLLFSGLEGGWLTPTARAFVAVGILGGFTTMSSFSYETVALFEAQRANLAIANIALTLPACLLGTWMGAVVGRAVLPSGA